SPDFGIALMNGDGPAALCQCRGCSEPSDSATGYLGVAHERSASHISRRSQPPSLRYVEDDPFGVLELQLEVHLLLVVTELEEKSPTRGFYLALRLGEVIDNESEMMRSHRWRLAAGSGRYRAGLVTQQCQVDDAVAQVNAGAHVQIVSSDAFHAEHTL